ncbi:MAG: EpsG family protein [Lachnospiraceae bacterium]|nr:EpsG family protein [Lachnospiraceae bacterium]
MKQKAKPFAFLREWFGESPVRWYDWVILAGLLLFCFVSYEMRDLLHTAGCSYGFLDGHFLDFYDYLAESGIGEDGTVGLHASYLPTAYIIFAIWNIPMKLFGVVPHATAQLPTSALMWAKILPCLVYFAGAYVVFLISQELGFGERRGKLLSYAYLTAPVALYGQFILGQYESFIVFAVLLGTLYWLRKKTVWFIFWFAVAVTFKYTALILFIPLIMLREKNFWKIFVSCIAVFALFALEFLIYKGSPAFMSYGFGVGSAGDNPTGYVNYAAYFTGYFFGGGVEFYVYLAYLAFAFVCAYAYFKKTGTPDEERRYGMFIACLALASMFCFSKWHPHWLMLAVPFWTITAFMHRDTKIFMILDLLFMVLFVMFCTGQFVGITDEIMLTRGIFKLVLPDGVVGNVRSMNEIIGKLDMSVELTLLTAMIAVFAVFKHPKFMREDFSEDIGPLGWIRARYILGLLFFIIPSLIVVKDNIWGPERTYEEDRRMIWVEFHDDSTISQNFVSHGSGIVRLKFPVSVGENPDKPKLYITISDEYGNDLWSDYVSTGRYGEGLFVTLTPKVSLTYGKTYTVSFRVPDATDRTTFCLLACPEYTYPEARKDGEALGYHLNMNVYQ